MPTLKQEIIYFNDAFGKIRPNCQMFFYEAGTTTQKNTYTQPDLLPANTNPWPLVSDGAGVFPPIFLESGGYRIIVKDKDGVTFIDRDDINVAETTILSTSDFYFEDLTTLKLGTSINGTTVNLQEGQIARTIGNATETDGGGAEWLVVAAGTGTADDDLFADLDNGRQVQRLFNQLYTNRNLAEIADAGATAQDAAKENIGIYATDVSGYVRANTVFCRDDGDLAPSFDVSAVVFSGSFESVGPTGSGATNIWTAMDDLPIGTKFVDILVRCFAANAGSGSAVTTTRFRPTGSAVTVNTQAADANLISGATNIAQYITWTNVRVALDSSRRFDVQYTAVSGTSNTVFIYLSGFGV